MKSRLWIVLLVVVAATGLSAQSWTQTPASGMQDVTVGPDGVMFAAGANATVWRSDNMGQNWVQTPASGMRRVDYNGTVLWAVGNNGTLWYSTNGGANWSQTPASGISDVAGAPSGAAVAVGEDGSIWVSQPSNYGQWIKTNASGFQSVTTDGAHIFAAGTNGTVWRAPFAHQAALSWAQTPAGGMAQVSFADGVLYAVGSNGTVWYSSNRGTNWTQTNASGMQSVAYRAGRAAAVGSNGTVWVTR